MNQVIDKIIKRNGSVVPFERKHIFSAMEKAIYS